MTEPQSHARQDQCQNRNCNRKKFHLASFRTTNVWSAYPAIGPMAKTKRYVRMLLPIKRLLLETKISDGHVLNEGAKPTSTDVELLGLQSVFETAET